MRPCRWLLAALTVAALAGAASAEPTIGVYFDKQGTRTDLTASPGQTVTAYIVATHTEQTIGGAAFQLSLGNGITLMGATYPPGIQVGDLQGGIQIGLTNCYYGYYDNPVLLATLTLSTGANGMIQAPLQILPYPPAGVIQLADCYAEITTVAGGWARLTVWPEESIGVYWDSEGTQTNHTARGGNDETHTAYIVALNTSQIHGAAFRLTMDPRITLTGATYPAGVQAGTLAEGIEIDFTSCYYAPIYGWPLVLATLSLSTGTQLIANGELNIVAYPPAGAIQLSDCNGNLRAVQGHGATLTIPVQVENKSWGEIKDLYGR